MGSIAGYVGLIVAFAGLIKGLLALIILKAVVLALVRLAIKGLVLTFFMIVSKLFKDRLKR